MRIGPTRHSASMPHKGDCGPSRGDNVRDVLDEKVGTTNLRRAFSRFTNCEKNLSSSTQSGADPFTSGYSYSIPTVYQSLLVT